MPALCLPFQERHCATGKAWKRPGTVSLQPDEMSPHRDCKVQPSSYTQLDLSKGSWASVLPPEHS